MIRAGELDERIAFQRIEATENDFGEPIPGGEPVIVGRTWAKVIYGKGVERRAVAAEGNSLPATFVVRDYALTRGITTDMQIEFDGGSWDVESNIPWGRDGREITAVRLM